jgi:hypothetical protein
VLRGALLIVHIHIIFRQAVVQMSENDSHTLNLALGGFRLLEDEGGSAIPDLYSNFKRGVSACPECFNRMSERARGRLLKEGMLPYALSRRKIEAPSVSTLETDANPLTLGDVLPSIRCDFCNRVDAEFTPVVISTDPGARSGLLRAGLCHPCYLNAESQRSDCVCSTHRIPLRFVSQQLQSVNASVTAGRISAETATSEASEEEEKDCVSRTRGDRRLCLAEDLFSEQLLIHLLQSEEQLRKSPAIQDLYRRVRVAQSKGSASFPSERYDTATMADIMQCAPDDRRRSTYLLEDDLQRLILHMHGVPGMRIRLYADERGELHVRDAAVPASPGPTVDNAQVADVAVAEAGAGADVPGAIEDTLQGAQEAKAVTPLNGQSQTDRDQADPDAEAERFSEGLLAQYRAVAQRYVGLPAVRKAAFFLRNNIMVPGYACGDRIDPSIPLYTFAVNGAEVPVAQRTRSTVGNLLQQAKAAGRKRLVILAGSIT